MVGRDLVLESKPLYTYLSFLWSSQQHGQMCEQPDQSEGGEWHGFGVQGVWVVSPLRLAQDVTTSCAVPPTTTDNGMSQFAVWGAVLL